MKKKILAGVLCVAMLASLASLYASAVPYTPSAIAFKDFGQENLYVYEVTKGESAPVMDGTVKDTDGYGDPVSTYSIVYCTTADKVVYNEKLEPLPEYVMREDGTFFVYPTAQSDEKIWKSISSVETTSGSCYAYSTYVKTTSFSASTSYYYLNPYTGAFVRAYLVTADTMKDYYACSSTGVPTYVPNAPYVLTTEKPADWEDNYKYYTTTTTDKDGKVSYPRVLTAEAPEWKENTYYSRERIHVSELYTFTEGTSNAPASLANLKANHVVLPEAVKLYSRYDNTYFYQAIEVVEGDHVNANYEMQLRFGVNSSNNMNLLFCNNSLTVGYRKTLDGAAAISFASTSLCRTYVSSLTSLNEKTGDQFSTAGFTVGILNKYGKADAKKFADAYTADNYGITRKSYAELNPVQQPATDATASDGLGGDGFGGDAFGGGGDGAEAATGEQTGTNYGSKSYGTTTYEYRQPWTVINDDYNGATDATAVPDLFMTATQIHLQNTLAKGAYVFAISLPRDTRNLPGSVLTSTGNYSKTLYTMRYPSNSGLTTGANFGTYRWGWGAISSGYNPFSMEYIITDYYALSNKKTYPASHIPPIWYTCGQKPDDSYKAPEYVGAQIRTDDAEQGGMRVLLSVPKTSKDIEEVGCVIAPTEVARRGKLSLGMTSIAYYCEDYAEYYGLVDGKWVNLCDDTDEYFKESTMPNDSDSFVTMDTVGGKPSGIYAVTTAKASLDNPYLTKTSYTQYSVEFTGLYDDFDDYFTFYTIHPYVKYSDGTVVYGEYQYKSLYYLACWTIQEMCSAYNESNSLSGSNQYNPAQMPLAATKDDQGNIIRKADGTAVYAPSTQTSTSMSSYPTNETNSLYVDEARLEVFRWYAIRVINRQNKTSLRIKYYDTFSEDAKTAVDAYVDTFEYIWQNYIVNCENKVYIVER